MRIRRSVGAVLLVSVILGLMTSPTPSWGQGQADDRIGTVLAVDGNVEAQAANTTTWEPLQFRAAIFQNDTVRTGADSKVKILLRDDSIMTLAERSEMQFTEFLLNPQQNQRRTVVSLALGKLRVVTTKIFGAGSGTEVRTPNTVAGVRGTTFIVTFDPATRTTTVLSFDQTVTVRNANPTIPQIEPVPPNFRTEVREDSPPAAATVISPAERQSVEQSLRVTEQVPAEVKTTRERQAAAPSPVRGEQATTAPSAAGPSPTTTGTTITGTSASSTSAPLGTQIGDVTKVVQPLSAVSPLPPTVVTPLPTIIEDLSRRTTATAPSTAPPTTTGGDTGTTTGGGASAPITPDSSPTAIPQRPLRLTIRIPR